MCRDSTPMMENQMENEMGSDSVTWELEVMGIYRGRWMVVDMIVPFGATLNIGDRLSLGDAQSKP